jgi:hypothetical protein
LFVKSRRYAGGHKVIMSTKKKRIPTRFEPETRFEVRPTATASFRAIAETELERLQARLLRELLHRTEDPDLTLLYRHVSREAVALASTTGFPLLILPVLFAEKAEAARLYAARQARILKGTSDAKDVAA